MNDERTEITFPKGLPVPLPEGFVAARFEIGAPYGEGLFLSAANAKWTECHEGWRGQKAAYIIAIPARQPTAEEALTWATERGAVLTNSSANKIESLAYTPDGAKHHYGNTHLEALTKLMLAEGWKPEDER